MRVKESVVIKNMDHLGLVAGMVDELEIENSVDNEVLADANKKGLSYGILVKAMILNGLGYVNKQLYLTPKFFEDKPLESLFSGSVKAQQINDDALGRTLDAIYNYGVSELYEKISHKAVAILGLSPSTIHLDSTSFHVDGDYKQSKPKNDKNSSDHDHSPIHITKGYSRDHHPHLNQVVLNLIVEHQGGIPLMMKAADGNQIDTKAFASIVDSHIDSLKAMNNSNLTLIADAALFSQKGLQAIKEKKINFISRVPMRLKEAKVFITNTSSDSLTPIDENYSFKEQQIEYGEIEQKWILYKSQHATARESKTLSKNLLQESIKSSKALKKLMNRVFFCQADAIEALHTFKLKNSTLIITNETLIEKPKFKTKGRPKPNQQPDHYEYYLSFNVSMRIDTLQQRIEEQSGYFILATNKLDLSAQELLQEYKSQQRVERGFLFLKSPEFLSDALFLKKPERIEAMLMIMTLCLMVYASLEYKIRKELKEQDKTFPNQLGKPVQNPTTRWVFECFFAIHMLYMEHTQKMVVGLNEQHRMILKLLGARYLSYYGEDLNEKFGAE